MNTHDRLLAAVAWVALLFGASALAPASAAEDAPKDGVLRGDATCTRCHDAESDFPVFAIGKTRHGVTADGRTPTCTDCHGPSDTHMNIPEGVTERPKPTRVFGVKSETPIVERMARVSPVTAVALAFTGKPGRTRQRMWRALPVTRFTRGTTRCETRSRNPKCVSPATRKFDRKSRRRSTIPSSKG